jgi:hypothetical protein
MTSSKPLHGPELIDCAQANANKEIEIVSELCGYGKDINAFEQELKKACELIGVKIQSFKNLREIQPERINKHQKIEITPETPNRF